MQKLLTGPVSNGMKADLHIHTNYSDGIHSPKEIVDAALKKGIKCVCITDHGEIDGAVEAMKYGFDKDILIVPGIELLTKSGDMLGINIKKIIPSGLSAADSAKKIRKQGGIAVIPHPFNRPFNDFWGGEKAINSACPDAIEVFNASVFFKSSNQKAFGFSNKNNFCFTAGSDAHRKQFVGRGYVEISENILTEKDLIAAIMNKKAKAGGTVLSFTEFFKNATNANIRSLIVFYCLKRKNIKK